MLLTAYKQNNRSFLTDGYIWEMMVNDSKLYINPDLRSMSIKPEKMDMSTSVDYLDRRNNLISTLEPDETSSFKYMEDYDFFYYLNLKLNNSSYIAIPKEDSQTVIIGKLSEIDLSNKLEDLSNGLYQSKLAEIKSRLLNKIIN